MPSTHAPNRRAYLAALGAAGASALAGCLDGFDAEADAGEASGDTDWPQPHFDAAAGSYNPTPAGPTSAPTTRWTVEIGWPSGRPVVRHGQVYVPTVEGLVAHDAASGEKRWQVNGKWVPAPATSPESVFTTVAEATNHVVALGVDGEERWRRPVRDRVATPPVYVEDVGLFVGDDAGFVYAIDPETGELGWEYRVFGGVSSLAVRFQSLVVGTTAGEVYALLDAGDHARPMWRRKLPGEVTATAVGDGGDAYVGTFGGAVARLRTGAHAGATDWLRRKAASTHGAVVLTPEVVVGTDGGGAHALRRDEGTTAWTVDGEFFCAPAAAGETLYVGGEDRVVAIDLGGGVGGGGLRFGIRRWSFDTNGAVGPGVTVADGAVFAPTHPSDDTAAKLYALESDS